MTTNRDIILCNETAVVYLDGMPVYTIIGNGCKSIAKLAQFYTTINNTVFFWHIENTSVTMFFKEQKERKGANIITFQLSVLVILFIRRLFFTEAE